ncbi:MAG: phosphotransferase [Acidimicrobiia bacterium]
MSVKAKAELAASVGRIGAHVVKDRLQRSRPTTLAEVPLAPEALTPQWLTAALCRDIVGAEVVGVAVAGGSDGTTTRRTLRITYNEAGVRAGLPATVFAKSTPRFTSRLVCGLSGAVVSESEFYSTIRPKLDLDSPVGYHAAVDTRSFRSMILLEDVASTRGARFGGPTSLPVTRPMAESVVGQMAIYHGAFWGSSRLGSEFPWLKTSEQFQVDINATIAFESRTMIGIDRARAVIPGALLDRRAELWPALMRSLVLNGRPPITLLHSDVHAGNWYVTGDGRMGLYDWQCMTKGQWALDFAYALLSALTVEDRRAWERELLELYLDRLEPADGPAPTFDEAWLAYRQQTFHALVFWLYTIGAGRLQPDMQPKDVCLANVERMANAVVDLESLDSLSPG